MAKKAGKKSLAQLEERLGYKFKDTGRLRHALSHSSALDAGIVEETNQRLEFLGDRVLGLVMAEWLMEDFPQAEEGELAMRLNALVRKEACAQVAEAVDLGAHLLLGTSEQRGGGRKKLAILGDACEAVIAAIYIDGGYEAAKTFIRSQWAGMASLPEHARPDAKTTLQEWAQGQGAGLPRYHEVAREGPAHAPVFTVEVRVKGVEPVEASGRNKRQAEQNAAETMLIGLGVWEAPSDENE